MIAQAGDIQIPMLPSEIKFSNFCAFQAKEKEFLESKEKELAIVEMVKAAYEIEDIDSIPYIPESLEKDYTFSLGDPVTILRLYMHFVNTINQFDPKISEDFELEYKGEKFVIDSQGVMSAINGAAYTTGEVITTFEYQRVLNKKPNHFDGAVDMQLGLIEMAILLRKPGERLPHRPAERDQFISERATFFKDLPMDVVLGVRFFLLDMLKNYEKISGTHTFGRAKRKLPVMTVSARRKTGLRRNFRKFGRYLGGKLF